MLYRLRFHNAMFCRLNKTHFSSFIKTHGRTRTRDTFQSQEVANSLTWSARRLCQPLDGLESPMDFFLQKMRCFAPPPIHFQYTDMLQLGTFFKVQPVCRTCRNKHSMCLIFRNNKPFFKTHQNPSVLCTPPFEKSLFLVGAFFGVGVYFGKYGMSFIISLRLL